MLKKVMKMTLVSAFALTVLAACNGGGGGGGSGGDGSGDTAAAIFVENLNIEDPAYSYTLAKDPTAAGYGWIVIKESTGYYWAVNIAAAERWDYDYDLDYYLDYSFQVWHADSPGYFVDEYGNLYQSKPAAAKDLEMIGAQIEKVRVAKIGSQLVANYGLSEARALELGQLLVDYKNLAKSGSVTAADEDSFAKQALGFTISEANEAVAKGDVNSLINKAVAANEGLTPESVREIMVKMVK